MKNDFQKLGKLKASKANFMRIVNNKKIGEAASNQYETS